MVEVFGSTTCPKCEEAKEILKTAKQEYVYYDASEFLEYCDDWKEKEQHLVKAYSEFTDGELPFIRINGNWVTLTNLKGMYAK